MIGKILSAVSLLIIKQKIFHRITEFGYRSFNMKINNTTVTFGIRSVFICASICTSKRACLEQADSSLLVALIINTDGLKNQHRVHYIVLGFFFTDQSDHSFSDFKTDCFFVLLGTWQLWGGNEVQMGKGQELQLSEMRWRQGRGNMLDRKGNKKSVTSCYPHFFIPQYHLRCNFLSNRQKQDLWG